MNEHNKNLELYLKSENFDAINEFLIEASKTPHLKNLIDIDYLITNSPNSLLNHFAINLIFLLGEISKNHFLSDYYIEFMTETYFKSDRWIRSEILFAFSKSIRNDDLFKKISEIIEFALTDDYDPIRINALTIINNTRNIPRRYFPRMIKNLESKNPKISEKSIEALKKHVVSIDILYEILLDDNAINLYNKQILRSIMLTFFTEVHLVEDFKKIIMNSDLDLAKKELVNSEIKTYKRILQQSIL
ncbi:MAG: hypothetical protein KGD73_11385 [Candidatus Lokiarchaeota archaeon]|nr:hypothetical protein [Candidatus Lokiarchaeota archaeon]